MRQTCKGLLGMAKTWKERPAFLVVVSRSMLRFGFIHAHRILALVSPKTDEASGTLSNLRLTRIEDRLRRVEDSSRSRLLDPNPC